MWAISSSVSGADGQLIQQVYLEKAGIEWLHRFRFQQGREDCKKPTFDLLGQAGRVNALDGGFHQRQIKLIKQYDNLHYVFRQAYKYIAYFSLNNWMLQVPMMAQLALMKTYSKQFIVIYYRRVLECCVK